MASSPKVVEYLVARMNAAGTITAKKMFGEYGIYCDAKMIGVVCDDRLFVKPTPAGIALVGPCEMGAPYPGAKPCLIIEEDRWAEAAWLGRVVRATADELPMPKPKKSASKER